MHGLWEKDHASRFELRHLHSSVLSRILRKPLVTVRHQQKLDVIHRHRPLHGRKTWHDFPAAAEY